MPQLRMRGLRMSSGGWRSSASYGGRDQTATIVGASEPRYRRRARAALTSVLALIMGVLTVLTAPAAMAENQGPIQAYDPIVFRAYVGAGETISVSGGPFTVVSPSGAAVGNGTYGPAAAAGVWTATAQPSGQTNPYNWDITVRGAGGVAIPGRVWTHRYSTFQTTASNANLAYWLINDTGYQYQVTLRNYNGINSVIRANATGSVADLTTCAPLYRSRDDYGGPTCAPDYRVFFAPPAADLPASAPAADGELVIRPEPLTADDLTVQNLAFARNSNLAMDGQFSFDLDPRFAGGYTLQIDVDGDGAYDGPADRSVGLGADGSGHYTYDFDGLDGQGNPVSVCSPVAARVHFDRLGEIHVLQADVEYRGGGIQITRLNGAGAPNNTIYWDDTALPTSGRTSTTPQRDGTAGVDSTGGVHGWGGAFGTDTWGNDRSIDDWTYLPIDKASDAIDIGGNSRACLDIEKTSDATAATRMGDTVTYSVTATNTGPTDFTADDPAEVIDDLTGVLDDATYNDDAAVTGSDVAATYTEPQLHWTGPLAAGDSVTLTYTVTLNRNGDQSVRNVAFVPPPCDAGDCPPPTPPTLEDCVANDGVDPATGLPCAGTETPLPKLTVTKSSADLGTAVIGDTVTYEVTATNTGQTDYTEQTPALVVDDMTGVLDDATFDGTVTVEGSDVQATYAQPQISWTGPLAIGDSITLRYSVVVTGDGDLTADNIAFETTPCAADDCLPPTPPTTQDCVDNNGIDPATGLACAPVSGPLPKLALTKTGANLDQARIGDTIVWTVSATNIGQRDYTEEVPATFLDDLTGVLDDATFDGTVSVDGSDIAAIYTQPQIGWSGPLAAGDTVTLTYSTVLTGGGDDHLENVAWQPPIEEICAPGDCSPPPAELCVDNVNSETGLPCVPVEQDLPLPQITKSSPNLATAHVGDVVSYTVTFTNVGPGDYTAKRPAFIADDLSGLLDDAAFDGSVSVDGSDIEASYAEPHLTWSGPVAAGESVTLTYQVTITGLGDLAADNLAFVPPTPVCTDEECPLPPNPPTPQVCEDNIDPETGLPCAPLNSELPKLSLTKASPDLAEAALGDTVTYTVTAKNIGKRDFSADDPAEVIDDLTGVLDDAAFDGTVSVDGSDIEATYSEPRITWSGPLAVDASVTLTYQVTLTLAGDTLVDNIAFVPPTTVCDSDDCPPPPTPGKDTCTDGIDAGTGLPCVIVEDPKPKLTVDKSSDAARVVRNGDRVSYTVTATNTGAGDYTAKNPAALVDDLTGVLDDGTFDGTVTVDGSKVKAAYSRPQISWSGPLAAGASVTLTYSVVASGSGDFVMKNVAFQPADVDCLEAGECEVPVDCVDGTDPDTGYPCVATETPLPALFVVKSVDNATPAAGDTLTYTVVMTNTGFVDFTGEDPAVLTDDLTDVLDDAAYRDDAAADRDGTVAFTSPVLTWTGPLAVGDSVTLTYTVTVAQEKSSDDHLENVASIPDDVTPRYPDGECPDGAQQCDPPSPTAIAVSDVERPDIVPPVDAAAPPVNIDTGNAGNGTGPNTAMVLAGSALLLMMLIGSAYWLVTNRRRRIRSGIPV